MKKYIKRLYFTIWTIPMVLIISTVGIWELWTRGSADNDAWDFWNR